MNTSSRILLVVAIAAAMAGCKSKPARDTAPADTGTTTTTPRDTGTAVMDDGRYQPSDLDSDSCLRQRVVYFDFDQDVLKPEFQAIVACHAKYLRDRPDARMTLEGHADERGTREYNLGLGERRGKAVNSAVIASGANGGQISVSSYGEERPTCMDSTEDCWSRNRRVEIVYSAR
jgi:peptidoglycan-associated lipoprotein